MSKRPRAYAWNRNFPKFSESFVSTRTQQPHDFNQPTQAQIERCKQFPPVEIKGVILKGSKLNTTAKCAVEQLMESIRINDGKHPFTWVEEAGMLAAFGGNKSIPFLLEILNAAIPLKEGMKLEGFSAKEFEQKYLHSRPSLLEQANLEIEGMENTDIRELSRIFDIVAKRQGSSQIKLRDESDYLYSTYVDAVENIEKTMFSSNWGIALFLQDGYWHVFRGYTISVIRLMNSIINHNKPQYDLPTPIDGMK
jgi:hypothetical protein